MVQNLTSIYRILSEEHGSAEQSSLTSSFHRDLRQNILEQTEKKHRPIMIHRVVFGSIERFIGILIEHYAGKFPTWLAPVQAKVLPVSDKFAEYAKKVSAELKAKGFVLKWMTGMRSLVIRSDRHSFRRYHIC